MDIRGSTTDISRKCTLVNLTTVEQLSVNMSLVDTFECFKRFKVQIN